MTSLKKKSISWLLPAFVYLGMTLVITYPLMLHFGDYFIGGEEDGSLSVWSLWWMKFALADHASGLFDCHYLFYPYGANLTFHFMPKVMGAAGILLQSFLSLAATYNLIVVLTFVASGLAAYWLALHLLHRALPAFVAGVFFAFSPFRLGQFSHVHMLSTMLIPVYIVLIIKAREALDGSGSRPWLYFGLAGVTMGLAAYDTEHYAIFLSVFSVLFLLFYLPWRRRPESGEVLRRWLRLARGLLLTLVVAVATFSPMLFAAARFVADSDDPLIVSSEQVNDLSADALSFFIPNRGGGLPAGSLEFINTSFLSPEVSFLGWVAMALAVLGAWTFRGVRDVRLWILTTVVFSILALGPMLIVAGSYTEVPMPYAVINMLPLLNMIRAPSRYVVIASLAVAVLSGYGAAAAFDWLSRRRFRVTALSVAAAPLAAVTIVALFIVEVRPQVNLVSLEAQPVYEEIAASGTPGSVISLPLGWDTGTTGKLGREAAFVELYQPVHKRPLIGGNVSRGSGVLAAVIASEPVIRFLADPEGAPAPADRDPATIAAILGRYQIAYIVVHKYYPRQIYGGRVYHEPTSFSPAELEAIDRYVTRDLGMVRAQENGEVTVYRRGG